MSQQFDFISKKYFLVFHLFFEILNPLSPAPGNGFKKDGIARCSILMRFFGATVQNVCGIISSGGNTYYVLDPYTKSSRLHAVTHPPVPARQFRPAENLKKYTHDQKVTFFLNSKSSSTLHELPVYVEWTEFLSIWTLKTREVAILSP